MNPAALKANLADVPKGRDAHRRHPTTSPPVRSRGSAGTTSTRSRTARWTTYQVHAVDLTQLTLDALERQLS